MAVTFAMYTSHPSLLACQLQRLEGEVSLQDGEPLNAVGVGSYAQDDVLLRRQPAKTAPASLSAIAPPEASEAVLYQAQLLPPKVSLEESGQPFRFRRWLFTFEGSIPALDQIRDELNAELPPYLQRQIGVETEGEAAFSLFLKYLRDVGRTDDRRLEATLVAELLGKSARELLRRSAQSGAVRTGAMTLVATNSHLLVAARLAPRPLHYKLLEGSSQCEVCGLKPGKSELNPEVRAHVRSRAVAVSSHVTPGTRWLLIPEAQALAVGPSLEPMLVPI